MKINEVDDVKIDEDGSTYRQSFVNQLTEAQNEDWDSNKGVELNEEYFAKVDAGLINPWD